MSTTLPGGDILEGAAIAPDPDITAVWAAQADALAAWAWEKNSFSCLTSRPQSRISPWARRI